ncbi:MAG TPA: glycosyltransferase family 39 protein [Anaerolineae bacterium]|nr:glycosyltransferase family 39 protein [Anaerolineae bacterium]
MEEKQGGENLNHEPTVLDWVKSLFRLRPIPIPEEVAPEVEPKVKPRKVTLQPAPPTVKELPTIQVTAAHLRIPVAVILALIAQFGLEQHSGSIMIPIALYVIAAGLLGWAFWVGDLPEAIKLKARKRFKAISVRVPFIVAGLFLSALTFLVSGDNKFDLTTLVFWLGAIFCTLFSIWEGEIQPRKLWERIRSWFSAPKYQIKLDHWSLLVILSFLLVAYFRFVNLNTVPYEMWSDHAEKLLDVTDVLNGKHSIYFPRNTGREAIQFYLAAATARLLGTGISFLTLKIGTALIGFITLPYIYLFAREVGGREVGLAALLLAGVAYWPNTISRLGLRFPLYPLFTAPVLYHMARGLRLKQRNQLLLAGLFAGIGLDGYSPARVVPLAFAVGVAIFMLHREAQGQRVKILNWLVAAGLIAFVVFVPLIRIAIIQPDLFLMRTVTRITGAEQAIPGSPLKILLENIWRGLTMFGWDNGKIWVISIPNRPALDWITGALFHLGIALVAIRYVKQRNWLDLFLLVSIPILMLPSTLSIAFPDENPAPNRAAGAMVPVFTLAAIPLAMIPAWVRTQWEHRRSYGVSLLVVCGLFLLSADMNYRLVLHDFYEEHRNGTWNTSDVGHVIQGFAESVGTYETAHVVPYPHWMDTRLVAMIAGKPTKDYALWPDDFETVLEEQRAQLFIVNPNDVDALEKLYELFPSGEESRWFSQLEGKDFLMYFVPPEIGTDRNLNPDPE